MTVNTQAASAVNIDATSKLRFDLDGQAPGWVFRWANPTGGDHAGDLAALIAAGQIDFTYVNGAAYTITTDASYTYVVQPVPEPATVLGVAVGAVALARLIRRYRRGTPG